MSALLGRRRVLVAIILVLVAVVATGSVVLAATVVRQGSVEYMKVVTEGTTADSTSSSWIDVPSTSLAMPVPSGEHDFFQITFSSNAPNCSRVNDMGSYGACYLRALVDGQPAAPGQVTFGQSIIGNSPYPETMQWASGVLAPGTHYVKLQFAVEPGQRISLANRTMTIVRARAY